MSAAYREIVQQRNGDEPFTLFLYDAEDSPIDLTGVTFNLQVRPAAGDGGTAIVDATNSIDPAETGIIITDATGGQILITILGEDFAAVDGEFEDVRLAYDLIATKDGIDTALMRGPFILQPGVTV